MKDLSAGLNPPAPELQCAAERSARLISTIHIVILTQIPRF